MLMGWRRVSDEFPSPRCLLRFAVYRRAFSIGPSLPASSKLGMSLRRSASHLQGSHTARRLGFVNNCIGVASKGNLFESSKGDEARSLLLWMTQTSFLSKP